MIAFGITALLLLGSAFMVVNSRDLVRAVLWLAVSLAFTAAAFVQLRADMLAALQIMLYTGGVITLMLFAVMLTWRRKDGKPQMKIIQPARGVLAAGAFLSLLVSAILRTELPQGPGLTQTDSEAVGALFLQDHVLAFETLSVILLAAMVGAIALARRKDAQ
jgi:NADH:ubiquinone oxidoreductase subunit 6 (subunit J)